MRFKLRRLQAAEKLRNRRVLIRVGRVYAHNATQTSVVSPINAEMLIAADQSIQAIKLMCDGALRMMYKHFDVIYAEGGAP